MLESATKHSLLGGKLHVYRRENSGKWQCSTYLVGKNHRASTGTDSLALAKDFAEDWYLTLHGKVRRGEVVAEKTFKEAAKVFEREYEVITEGQRSPAYVRGHKDRIRLHLNPFFGSKGLSQVAPGLVQEYRIHRRQSARPPARTTLHHELVTLRQVLKTGVRHGWLAGVPDLTAPYKSSGKIAHRAWFSPREYKALYEATRKRANDKKNHKRKAAAQLHDYVLFMANTGLRPDEAAKLEYRDVEIIDDKDTGERILLISVRGKRGVGYCKSTRGAVRPFERIRERYTAKPKIPETKAVPPKPTARVFPSRQHGMLNKVLEEAGLKLDREGQRRTAYSLRHSYICFRLMEGADIYQIAKNCRTSVEMIEKFYAAHIQTTLNAAAIKILRQPKRFKSS
ncbi:site-specific integrase [Sphingomonas sp.]|uniref:tyrosine-type recombinase/integrase n=1 Tax=Sphingomonas sp. TaxID=28214 RepID=UPI002DBF87E5|nr:site-specific integrase [Sphingomonas sp.]HEU4969757.1 site-specific integrase [Sphingomonas sp.]